MFKGLNESKMSSQHQNAKVFSYPGATAKTLLYKLKHDPNFLQINPSSVQKVYILCGTNNVDQILGVHKENYTGFITNHYPSNRLLNEAQQDITSLIEYLHQWAQLASINILNILPRVSACRNLVINQLNQFIAHLSDTRPYVQMVRTEAHRNLFSFKSGDRKNNFLAQMVVIMFI